MRIVTFVFSTMLICSSILTAQTPYKSEILVGGGMHTRGFQLTGLYSIIQNENKNLTFQIEFSELKSPKEKKMNAERRAIGGNSNRSYIYGKENNLYTLKLAAGQRFYISEKTDKSPVAIAFSCSSIEIGLYSFKVTLPFLAFSANKFKSCICACFSFCFELQLGQFLLSLNLKHEVSFFFILFDLSH